MKGFFRSIFVAVVLLLACTSQVTVAHHHHHGLFHRIVHGIGHVFHKVVHEVEHVVKEEVHVVKEIGHEIGHLVKEAEHGIVHVVDEVVHAAKKIIHVIVKIVHAAEIALLKINDKIFGPMLGPIMDKLEMALIESIPGVGQVVKIVVEGVDIADKVDTVAKCWKARDFGCVGNAVGGIVSDVSGTLTNKAGDMTKFAKAVAKGGKFVENACTVAEDVYNTYDALDDVVKVVKDHGNPEQIIEALGNLGGVLGDVDNSLSGMSKTQTGLWKNVATALDKGVGFVQKGDKLVVGALDVVESVTKLKQCLCSGSSGTTCHKDYECAGSTVADITNAVGQELTWVDPAMSKFANKVTAFGNGVSTVSHEAVGAYNAYLGLKGAMSDFTWPGSVEQVEDSVKNIGTSLSSLAGSLSSFASCQDGSKQSTCVDAKKFQAVCDRLVSDVTVFQNGDPKKGPIGKAGAIVTAGVDITEQYKKAKACTGKDGNVAEKSAYLECLGQAVNGIVAPLSNALGAETGKMHQIIHGISVVGNTAIKIGTLGEEMSADYHKVETILDSISKDHSLKNLETQGMALGAALGQTVSDVTMGHVDGPALWKGVCDKVEKEIQVITDPRTKSGKVNIVGVALDVGAVLVQASTAIKNKDYPKVGALLQQIFTAVGLKLEKDSDACKNAMNGVSVNLAGIPITLHGKGPLLGNQLFKGYDDIKQSWTDVLALATPEHVQAFVTNVTHMLGQEVVHHTLSPDGSKLWTSLLATLENATKMELSNDGKVVKRLVLAGQDEVDLLAELKAFASKLFAGDLKLTDVVSGLGVGLPSKYQMPSVYVPLSKNVVAKSRSLRGLMTKRGIDNRRRTFLFHHKHKKHAPPPKVNCAGTYSAWSKCSHPCGNIGTMTRKFTITTHPSNGGTACPASVQSQACNRKSCPLPATAATLLNQIVGRAKTFIDNHGKSLFDVMEGLNSEVEILHRDHNAPISLPATYKTNVDEFVQVAAAFRALASSMETAAQLAQLSDTHSAPSFNETSLLVYEFTAELTEALDRMAEFSPKGASENVWDAVASSIQMATVAHPEKTSIGLNLLVAASTKDLMPIIISAGRHWMAKDFKGIGSDLGKIFVETWAQSVSSLQSLHSVVRGTWQANEEHACSLYNEFGFAFSHLAAVDRPGLDNDRKSSISTFPDVVIPDNETHGVVRLAYALNETSYATSSIPADLQLQITHAVKAIDEAARTGEIVVSSDGKLQSVFVETYTQKHRMDVGNFLKNAAQYWSKKNYAAVGYQLQAMIQQISK